MAWQDREYYRDQDSGPTNPVRWLLTGSVPLFTAFGIRVRMHAFMAVLIVLLLVFAATPLGYGVRNTFTFISVLFGIILLHEFGHCFAARSVGGDARDILMTPIGGLAFADAPKRAWPQFVTVAGGPAVNVVICLIAAIGMAAFNWHTPGIPLNPLSSKFVLPYDQPVAYFLYFVFGVSWGLLLFNIMPVFPLDGGRLLQTLLWPKLGLYRANLITAVVGMIGAALMVLVGLTRFSSLGGGILFFIGLSCLVNCYQLRAQTKAAGPWGMEEDSNEFEAAMWKPDEVDEPVVKRKSKRLSPRAVKKLRKQAQAEEAEQARLDSILAKVSAHGMQSLTWSERRVLHKATQRQREVEVSRDLD
ncbi:MAG TPA: site-2 protease family protein [Tepidisphaeraceae bacterium]|jgi:Zn-dependent protease